MLGDAAAFIASTSMSMTTENWSFTFLRSPTRTVAELPTSVFSAVSASEIFFYVAAERIDPLTVFAAQALELDVR